MMFAGIAKFNTGLALEQVVYARTNFKKHVDGVDAVDGVDPAGDEKRAASLIENKLDEVEEGIKDIIDKIEKIIRVFGGEE